MLYTVLCIAGGIIIGGVVVIALYRAAIMYAIGRGLGL